MAQKAKCLTGKINHLRKKEQLTEAVRMKKVRMNIRCVGKMHGGKVIEKLEFIEKGNLSNFQKLN